MAHFAKINLENKVLTVLTLNNSDMTDINGIEEESIGQQYLQTHNHWPAHLWIQTSYNTDKNKHLSGGNPFRGNYAGIGWTWSPNEQIFWRPKPYPSWIKDIENAHWKSPIGDAPQLTEEQKNNKLYYDWNESNQVWELKDPNQI
jgi:hypothetical protein